MRPFSKYAFTAFPSPLNGSLGLSLSCGFLGRI